MRMEQKAFLTPSLREIKKSIRDIDDSYNNDWDILAELCQNSVDAIKKEGTKEPVIHLEINALEKAITIRDNGIGINPEELPVLLAPFSTNKEGDSETIGEKGVGLTFVLFSCNYFEIISSTPQGASKGIIYDANHWKKNTANENISIHLTHIDNADQGTTIILKDINDIPLFKLSYKQIQYILRTKTALGNTNFLWKNDEKEIKIFFKYTDLDGRTHEDLLSNKYWMIYDDLDDRSKIDLEDFIQYANDANKTDADKRRKLQDKIIYHTGEFEHHGRTIKYATCFVPKRKVWDDLSISLGLCSEASLNDNTWLDELSYSKFNAGIYTSVKGMPTGISIEHPTTGYAGYWANIFILFEDKHLKFDIGRKSIHGMTARIYKSYAKEIFNIYLKYITKYVSGEVIANSEWDKDEIFAEIEKMLDLNNKKTNFLKTPKDQEASVAGIFYEAIGKGYIKDIKPLVSGYRNKYDLYAKLGNKKLVIEIKSKLKNILSDFNDEQKLFNEIDLIVCWNVTEEDRQAMYTKGISVEDIHSSSLTTHNPKYIPNTTHELILSGYVKPIYIIDMKKILDNAE